MVGGIIDRFNRAAVDGLLKFEISGFHPELCTFEAFGLELVGMARYAVPAPFRRGTEWSDHR